MYLNEIDSENTKNEQKLITGDTEDNYRTNNPREKSSDSNFSNLRFKN